MVLYSHDCTVYQRSTRKIHIKAYKIKLDSVKHRLAKIFVNILQHVLDKTLLIEKKYFKDGNEYVGELFHDERGKPAMHEITDQIGATKYRKIS